MILLISFDHPSSPSPLMLGVPTKPASIAVLESSARASVATVLASHPFFPGESLRWPRASTIDHRGHLRKSHAVGSTSIYLCKLLYQCAPKS